MSFWDSIKEGLKNHFDKNKAQEEQIAEITRLNKIEASNAFASEFTRTQKKVLIAKAKRDANVKSGNQRYQAANRLRNLEKEDNPASVFDNFKQYTRSNLARREERLKETEAKRQLNQKMRLERVNKLQQNKIQSTTIRKPFSPKIR